MKKLLVQLSLLKMISDTNCQALYTEFQLQPMTFNAQPITTRCFNRSSHSSIHSGRKGSMETSNSCINDVHHLPSSTDVSCLPTELSYHLRCRIAYSNSFIPVILELVACNPIARSYVYWPSMDTDVEKVVKSCRNFQQASKNPPKQEPVPWPQTNSPWTRVHIDFVGPINGVTYLIVTDSYSKWPEVISWTSATTTAKIAALRRIFSQHGLPEIVVSDNGTQFPFTQFNDFCQQHCIKHIFPLPYHPHSNGQAERFVDTFKRALLKAHGEGTSEEVIQQFLFAPHKALSNQLSPAEALMGRKVCTVHHALLPIRESTEDASATTGYSIGTNVCARDYRLRHNRWIEGVVTGRHVKVVYDVSVAGKPGSAIAVSSVKAP